MEFKRNFNWDTLGQFSIKKRKFQMEFKMEFKRNFNWDTLGQFSIKKRKFQMEFQMEFKMEFKRNFNWVFILCFLNGFSNGYSGAVFD